MRGQVIGIVTVKVTNGQNINLALGAARVASIQNGELISFDRVAIRNRSNQPEALADLWYRGGIDSMWLGNYENALNYFETAANRNPQARGDVDSNRLLQSEAGPQRRSRFALINGRSSSVRTPPTGTTNSATRTSLPGASMKPLPLIGTRRNCARKAPRPITTSPSLTWKSAIAKRPWPKAVCSPRSMPN